MTVTKLQIGLLATATSLRKKLDEIARQADTSSVKGLHFLLQGGLHRRYTGSPPQGQGGYSTLHACMKSPACPTNTYPGPLPALHLAAPTYSLPPRPRRVCSGPHAGCTLLCLRGLQCAGR